MKRAYIIAATACVLSFLIAGSTFLSNSPIGEKVFFAGLVIITLLHIGAATIFMMALKGFQKRLRTAYILICASFLMLEAGVVDDLYIDVQATLFGTGVPLFTAPLENQITLEETERIGDNNLLMHYKVHKS